MTPIPETNGLAVNGYAFLRSLETCLDLRLAALSGSVWQRMPAQDICCTSCVVLRDAQARLAHMISWLRSLFDVAPDAHCLYGRDGNVFYSAAGDGKAYAVRTPPHDAHTSKSLL